MLIFVLHRILKIMARTVENKWFTEEWGDYPYIINTGWQIRIHIRWYDNIPGGRIGDVRFEVTTAGCDKTCQILKEWCVRVNVRRFNEDSRNSLDRINIRSHLSWDEKLLGSNLGKRYIRARHCLKLHLNIGIFMLGKYVIGQSLKPLLWIGEVRAQLANWNT